MEITTINQTSAYQNTGNVLRNTANRLSREALNTRESPAYKVSISSEGRHQSLSSFNRTQQTERSAFQRGQNTDSTSNDRRLENERETFERSQAAEARQFESRQSLKKMRFMREITRSVP